MLQLRPLDPPVASNGHAATNGHAVTNGHANGHGAPGDVAIFDVLGGALGGAILFRKLFSILTSVN